MNEFQKIIKYGAMGLAALLAVTIIGGIATTIMAIAGIFSSETPKDLIHITESFTDVTSLYIAQGTGTLNIRISDSDEIVVEANNVTEDFYVEKTLEGELVVTNDYNMSYLFENSIGNQDDVSILTIYLPEEYVAQEIELVASAGMVQIAQLNAKKIYINAGAGKFVGNQITAEQFIFQGGVGDFIMSDVKLGNSEINCGVGKVKIEGDIYGRSSIDAGVGNIELNITRSRAEYQLNVDTGLGSILIDGKKYSDTDSSNLSATNYMDINGGVGSIKLHFQK